jgi:hypothetical protein
VSVLLTRARCPHYELQNWSAPQIFVLLSVREVGKMKEIKEMSETKEDEGDKTFID